MKVVALVVAAGAVVGSASVRAQAQAPASGPTVAAAESLARKLTAIEARKREKARKPGTVEVTEHELNSYLNLKLKEDMPTGISDVQVSMQRERLQATGQVDLDKLDVKKGASPFSPLNLLSGKVPVLLRGRLQSQDGFGNVQIEEVQLATIPVPISVLERLIATSTRNERNPEGFDINAPFRFPYSVKRVRIEPGRALLDF
ncbi:MAG TPA: hypothetical protein VFQ51_13030 [Vicinamibacteria bacterium]|nr:hypothetical protein [Vicinamibacteria bacterium]